MRELATLEGLIVCPEGAATWAAAKQLLRSGAVSSKEKIVLFNTASGLKYPDMLERLTKCL